MDVLLYKCECFDQGRTHGQSASEPPDSTIPFFKSVEIGRSAAERHGAPSSLAASDLADLCLTFERVSLTGTVVRVSRCRAHLDTISADQSSERKRALPS